MLAKVKIRIAAFLISIGIFLTASPTVAASANGFGKLTAIPALLWDIFTALLPFFLVLAVLSILAYALPPVRKFFGGLID